MSEPKNSRTGSTSRDVESGTSPICQLAWKPNGNIGTAHKKRRGMSEKSLLEAAQLELCGGLSWPIRQRSKIPVSRRWVRFVRVVGALVNSWLTRGLLTQLIPGSSGAESVSIVIIDHRHDKFASGGTPALLHIHGGGYIVGRPGQMMPTLKGQSAELNCLVVSVDYHLAPGTPFPGVLEDN
jgi:hypothetical protein